MSAATDKTLPIVERLRRTEERPVFIETDDGHGWFDSQDLPINPDGPEAADTIEALVEALEAVGERLREANYEGYFDADIRRVEDALAKAGAAS